jgi:hypothetical protein
LIAPAVNPSIILLWNAKANMMIGMVTTSEAAAISPQGISCRPGKRAIPTGIVLEAIVEVKVRAKRNSFQEKMNTNIAVAKSPGVDKGKMIL